jgi:Tfp pilus assembly protein PilV
MAVADLTCNTDRGTRPQPSRHERRAHAPGARSRAGRPRGRGFSVAEGLIASAVLAIAVVGVAGPLIAASEHARVARERTGGLAAARQLMEEISAHPLCNGTPTSLGPTLPAENTRAKYDTVGDYQGYHDTTATVTTLDGSATVSGSQAVTYVRDVTVEYKTWDATTGTFSASANVTDFAVATVAVTTPHKQVVRVSRLFCKETTVR